MQRYPIFRISEAGQPELIAHHQMKGRDESIVRWVSESPWPLDEDTQDGHFDGLPYFLQDLRPEGYLGKAFADTYGPELNLPSDPEYWADGEVLLALSKWGIDTVGDLLVGDAALEKWHLIEPNNLRAIQSDSVGRSYFDLSKRTKDSVGPASIVPGSNAKFTATRWDGEERVEVLVKYSEPRATETCDRWADLLVCEHLAAQTIRSHLRLEAAETRIVESSGSTFLECVRFDRHARKGRSPVTSCFAISCGLFGTAGRPWPESASSLVNRGLIEETTFRSIALLWSFGQLIGNSDMHEGNLSFRPTRISGRQCFSLAPAYDMLPMLYAPQTCGLPSAPIRTPSEAGVLPEIWHEALLAAQEFWALAAMDARISVGFRSICEQNVNIHSH